MAKLLVNFAQARDHLKIGTSVTVRSGDMRPRKADVAALNLWRGHNYTGKIVKLDADGMDVEVERESATIIYHYDSQHSGLFEINDGRLNGAAELRRRANIAAMPSDELITVLLDEIDELRARVVTLEQYIDSGS